MLDALAVIRDLLPDPDRHALLERGGAHDSSRKLPMTLWLFALIPTRLPAATSETIIRAPV